MRLIGDLREIHDWFVKGPEGGDGVELTAAEVEDTWLDVLAFSREAERRSLHVDEAASQLAAHVVQARPLPLRVETMRLYLPRGIGS